MSSINFCEKDYLISAYIAEYYNTISNIPMILLGYYGLYVYYKIHNKYDIRFLLLICIGVGSFLFHATMSRFGQLLDEIPMIWMNSALMYEIIPHPYWFVSAFLITIFYGVFYHFMIFFIYFFITGAFVFISPFYTLQENNHLGKKMAMTALTLFSIGFIKWILDFAFCESLHDYYLHAWWHVWTGFSAYFYIQYQYTLKPHYIYSKFPLLVVTVIKNKDN